MSINDKLGELRQLVDGRESKVCLFSVCLSSIGVKMLKLK